MGMQLPGLGGAVAANASPQGLLADEVKEKAGVENKPLGGIMGLASRLSPQEWMQIAASFDRGNQEGSWSTALSGIGDTLQGRADRKDQAAREAEAKAAEEREIAYRQQVDEYERQWREKMHEHQVKREEIIDGFTQQKIDLSRAGSAKPRDQFRVLSAEEAQVMGLPPGTTYQVNTATGQMSPLTTTRDKTFTADQSKIAGFTNRMLSAHGELAAIEAGGFDPSAVGRALRGGAIASQPARQYDRAQRDFASAVLRRETGAQINDSEMEDVKRRYFPMVNDSPETMAAKKRAREGVIRDYVLESGGAYESRYGAFDPETAFSAPPSPTGSQQAIATPQTREELEALPSGTVFIDPQGNRRIKP